MEQEVKIKKKHNWWKYLLSFIFGFIFAIGGLAGSLVIVGTQISSKDVMNMIGVNPDEYLTETYQGKSIYTIIMELASGKMNFNSLGSIREITPYVDTLVSTINENVEKYLGFTFDTETLYSTDFSNIGDYLYNSVTDGVKLDFILNVNSSSEKILQYLSYPKKDDGTYDYDNPRSISTLMDSEATNELINNIKVSDVMDVGTSSDNGNIIYLLKDSKVFDIQNDLMDLKLYQLLNIKPEDYGTTEKLYGVLCFQGKTTTDADGKTIYDTNYARSISDLTSSEGQTALVNDFFDVPLEDLVDVTESSGVLYNLRSLSINELSAGEIDKIALEDLVPGWEKPADGEEDTRQNIIKFLGKYSIADFGDLESIINTATLGDLLGEDGVEEPFSNLLDMTISDLKSGTDLTIGKIYGIPEGTTENTGGWDYVIFNLRNEKLSDFANNMSTYTLSTFIEIDSNSSSILKALKDATLSNIDETINTMELCTILGYELAEDGKYYKDGVECPTILATLMDCTINTVSDRISNLTIGDLGLGDDIALLSALKNAKLTELGTEIKKLTMKDLLGITEQDMQDNKILAYIANGTLNEDDDNYLFNLINNMTLGDVLSIDESSNKLLQSLATCKIDELGSKIETLKLSDMIDIETDPNASGYSQIMYALKDCTLNNISDKIKTLKLSEMMTIETDPTSANYNQLLVALKDETLDTIGTRLKTLTIADVFDSETLSSNKFLKCIDSTTLITDVGNAMVNLKFTDVFSDEIYDTEGNVKSTWKYLLKDPETGTIHTEYTLGGDGDGNEQSDMSDMINNMSGNIQNATLQDLYDDGFITLSDPSVLNKKLGFVTLGSMTIAQLINAVANYAV